jgi:DegV family protein with EDD domain
MEPRFAQALIAGVERVAAWADLLDDINVFPVADGDTGRNLIVSLAPLRRIALDREAATRELLLAARGNSGNIAARFLSGFLLAEDMGDLAGSVRIGSERARQAVRDPRPGTMLTVFEALVTALEETPPPYDRRWRDRIIETLEAAVLSTPRLLPKLAAAGVVDAGALGIFIYLEGFFLALTGGDESRRPVTERFKGRLQIVPEFRETDESGVCVDTVLRIGKAETPLDRLSALGESVVVLREGEYLKVHLHAPDERRLREEMASLGDVVRWSADDLESQVHAFRRRPSSQAIHLLTDAAGSVSRDAMSELGVTVLDSYITLGERCLPESRLAPEALYAAMRRGEKVSTAQASLYERSEHYRLALERYPRVLYLCVGSAYTGNCAAALDWKKKNDPEERFTVLDTQAASGRLGVLATAVARFARRTPDAEAVIRFAAAAVGRCREYVFLDKLQYLAAGGRLSRSNAFFGDMFHMKPIISPMAEGVRKMGVVRSREEQVAFALERLAEGLAKGGRALVMIEYTDNGEWVRRILEPEIARRHPEAETLLVPMSLTAGAHMGPGTWAVAFLPEGAEEGEG